MSKAQKKLQPKPLRPFNYKLVAERLEGFLTNVDRDLQRRVNWSDAVEDEDSGLWMTCIDLMMRFAINSYHAVLYLVGDEPQDSRRKKNFMLVLPGINRQLLDLLFSLVYMLDDFPGRCLDYQRSGWREIYRERQHWNTYFGSQQEWKPFLDDLQQLLYRWEGPCRITSDEKKDPNKIELWKTPTQLKDKRTKSRAFLRYLDKWIYADISAQAHLSFGGLMKSTPMLLAELVGGDHQQEVDRRVAHQYHFAQTSRTAVVTLAIATEINCYFELRNHEQALMLWHVFGEYVVEANEIYEKRYKVLLENARRL